MTFPNRKLFLAVLSSFGTVVLGRAAEPETVEAQVTIVTLKKDLPGTEALFVDADDKPTKSVVVSKLKGEKWIESASKLLTTTAMQAPTLTLADGQSANASVGNSLVMITGVEVTAGMDLVNMKTETVSLMTNIHLTCKLDADGDKARVKFRYELPTLANPDAASYVGLSTAIQFGGPKVPVTFALRDPKVIVQTMEATATAECGRTMAFRIPGKAPGIVHNVPVTRIACLNRFFKMKSDTIERESVALVTLRKVKPTDPSEKISTPAVVK